MKRLVAVLSGLLVLPAFAEVAPIVYDEVIEYSGEEIVADDAVVADENTTEKVVKPVVQPSKNNPRGATASSRAASRVVPSGTAVNSRSVSARNASSSRNATQARTGTATASRTNATATRVTSRSAATNRVVSARAGSLVQTDTVNKPLYTGRVSVRSSSAIQARSPSTAGLSVTSNVDTINTDVADLDQLAQMTDYCKAQYMSCMDNFCNVLDDNQGRCSCSKNLNNYEKTETALKKATESLQDIAQQIQYIGLTRDQVETLFAQTEAELALANGRDNSAIKKEMDKTADMIFAVPTGKSSTSTSSGLTQDIAGLFNISFSSDNGFANLFGGTANTSSISNQRGEDLYKTATARCRSSVLNTCQAQGVDISVITNSYDLEIDKQCIAYERSLNEANDNMTNTIRNAKTVLQKARLMVAQQKNEFDLRGCINELDKCMQDEFVCGSDYESCLDPTGKYIVNGAIVNGSTPGKTNNIEDNKSANGLYAVWNYDSNKNAWQETGASLSEYISESVYNATTRYANATDNLAQYLQTKIGYHDDKTGKNTGMCIGVLNRCQDYTYAKDGKFIPDNQVLKEYLQRTLVRVKATQDEILSEYAENCLEDVYSCMQQNSSSYYGNYNSNSTDGGYTNVQVNACKSQIKTCMSAIGEQPAYSVEDMKTWLKWALNGIEPDNQGG